MYLLEPGAENFKRGGQLNVVVVADRQARTRLMAGKAFSFPPELLVEQKFNVVNGKPVPEVATALEVDEMLLEAQGYHSDPKLVQERRVRVFLFTGNLSDVQPG